MDQVQNNQADTTPQDISQDNSQNIPDLSPQINKDWEQEEEVTPSVEGEQESTPEASVPEEKEVKAEEPSKPETPTLSSDEIAEKASQKLLEKLQPKEPQAAAEEQPIWVKEGRKPTYRELTEYIREDTVKAIRAEEEQRRAEEQKRIEEQTVQVNQMIDEQVTKLRSTGQLPAVANPNDPNDPGVKASDDLLKSLLKHNQSNPQKAYSSVLEYYFFEYAKKKEAPVGAHAPIAGASGSTPTGQMKPMSYEELHAARSYEDLLPTDK